MKEGKMLKNASAYVSIELYNKIVMIAKHKSKELGVKVAISDIVRLALDDYIEREYIEQEGV